MREVAAKTVLAVFSHGLHYYEIRTMGLSGEILHRGLVYQCFRPNTLKDHLALFICISLDSHPIHIICAEITLSHNAMQFKI